LILYPLGSTHYPIQPITHYLHLLYNPFLNPKPRINNLTYSLFFPSPSHPAAAPPLLLSDDEHQSPGRSYSIDEPRHPQQPPPPLAGDAPAASMRSPATGAPPTRLRRDPHQPQQIQAAQDPTGSSHCCREPQQHQHSRALSLRWPSLACRAPPHCEQPGHSHWPCPPTTHSQQPMAVREQLSLRYIIIPKMFEFKYLFVNELMYINLHCLIVYVFGEKPSSELFSGSPRDAVDRRRRARTHPTPFAASCSIQRHPPRPRTPPSEPPSVRRKSARG